MRERGRPARVSAGSSLAAGGHVTQVSRPLITEGHGDPGECSGTWRECAGLRRSPGCATAAR
jgi:hypothetical protein